MSNHGRFLMYFKRPINVIVYDKEETVKECILG